MSKRSESSSRGDSLDTTMTSLKVAVRVRPLNDKEINLDSKIVVDVLGNDIVITDLKVPEHQGYDHRSRVHRFSFDYGFSSVDPASKQYASQATVFENFGRVVLQALLEGYNCCVIAYGQSGSGKTYTMMGMKDEEGLTPRICEGLLMKLEDEAKQNISFAVNISYMEIYNEQVYDLLQKSDERASHNKPRLRVREHPIHGPFVEGLSTHVLKSRDNVCQLISEGNDNRIKAATYIHERSSRSHAIFTVHCSQACLDESQPKEVVSKLQLVDLAGSEKAGHEFCQSRLKEGANINKSLVTLGNVISALVELSQRLQNGSCKAGRQLFVPYRDSQLTWLMKDSLGGNSHTFMLAAVSPSKECYSETLSTLRYAQRAKNVLTVPIVNEDPATKNIRNLRLEVNKLKSLLVNADVLTKKAAMKPLPDISHLNSIMQKSEKKVDHLTRCWFEKWLETYNSVMEETDYLHEESSNIKKGTEDILQSVASKLTAEGRETVLGNSNLNYNVRTSTPDSSLSLKTGNSDVTLSDKSSSVSSECIILPNDIIFYSKGKSHKHKNYLNNGEFNLKSISSDYVCDTHHEITVSTDKDGSSSSPVLEFNSNPVAGISLCSSMFKSLPALNCMPASTTSIQNPFFIHQPLSNYASLPEDVRVLPECIKTSVKTDKADFYSEKCHKDIDNYLGKICEEKRVCSFGEKVDSDVDKGNIICRNSDEMKSYLNNEKLLLQKVRNDTDKDICDRHFPIENINKSLSVCKEFHDNQCTTGTSDEFTECKTTSNGEMMYSSDKIQSNYSIAEESDNFAWKECRDHQCTTGTSDEFTECKTSINREMYSCEEIQFNDSVAEESNNFVKLLNQIQDGSAETINHGFHRKDSEILSLLSLSSSDFPPFHSLDKIFDDYDDMDVPDGISSVDFDVLYESRQQCGTKSWDELYSSSDVTDGSESSDAESEFDYLDFTKTTVDTGPKSGICSDSSTFADVSSSKIFQDSKSLMKTSSLKENEMKLKSGNLPCIMEVSHELPEHCGNSPLLSNKSSITDGTDKVSTTGQKGFFNYPCDSDEIKSTKNISDKRKGESFAAYLKETPVLQKRLCNSDSTMKLVPNDAVQCSSKSDNTIYITSKEHLSLQELSDNRGKKENEIPHKKAENNDIHEKVCVSNEESVSNLLDFSVQDILDMINGKGTAQSCVVFKEQVYPEDEEKFLYDSAIPEEIQKFIDSTEITDANKLADELLKKKIFEYPASMACLPTNRDSVLNKCSNQNKPLCKSQFRSSQSDTDKKSYGFCDDKNIQQDLDTVVFGSDGAISHSQLLRKMKEVSDNKQSNNIRPTGYSVEDGITHNNITDNTHNTEDGIVPCIEEAEVEKINCPQENENFMFFKNLHTAIEEVHCENENALEFFTFNEYKEFSLDPISKENDYLKNIGNIMNESKKSSMSQQIDDDNSSTSVMKKTVSSGNSAEIDTVLLNSHFHNFATESPDNSINNSNSQGTIFTDYSTFGNLNITSLTPIEEEAVDDEVVSDVSEDDSPNVSFQFDSLERPKNTLLTKNCFPCIEPFRKTKATDKDNNQVNAEELHEPEKLNNMVIDDTKSFYDKNSDFFTKICTGTKKQDNQNVELSNSNFNQVSFIKMSNEDLNLRNMLEFSPTLGPEESSVKYANASLSEVENHFQFHGTEKNGLLFGKEDTDMCTTSAQNVDSFKNKLDLKINRFDEVNNLSNQLCCSWDSPSSSTSSDSITFVFVGKENKDITLEANSRSFQSSLFSSVSLDSLEKSSIHQNQVSCISPRTLSIDSLVAEELLFQLRNSDPIQPLLTSEAKKYASNKDEVSDTTPIDQKLEPKKTNFAATSQLNCNQHLKMHRYAHSYVENNSFSQDVVPEILETEKCKAENVNCDVKRNKTIIFQPNASPSESCSENVSDKQFRNLSEKYSPITTESDVDIPVESCNYLKTSVPSKHHSDKNVHYSASDDCIKENHMEDFSVAGMLDHILKEENVFNTRTNSSIKESYYNCIDLGSNDSSAVLNDDSITTSIKSLENSVMNNYTDIQKQMYLPENIHPKEESFCDKYTKSDHNELFSVKELTEENLKIFNSEFEENHGETYILPPPSTFDVFEDNGLSVISNSSSFSLVNHSSKTVADVFSKSTQTEQSTQYESNQLSEKDTATDSRNEDLIVRMMDLMVETLKLMKEQYSRTPKEPVSQPRRKLHFSDVSDRDMTDQKQMAIIPPAATKHRQYLTKEMGNNGKVEKYMQSVLPASNENDYHMSHSELLPYPKKNSNENSLNRKNKLNHDDTKIGYSGAKKPNFYTLPFDFITSKYQCKTPTNTSEFRKPDVLSQTSVDCLPNKARRSNFNEFNNLAEFNSASSTEHSLPSLKQNNSKLGSSKSYLKHLIELRRKVVDETMGSSNNNGDVNFENHITDPLKSPSSSSEGYLSSVSSRGPYRQFSEVSTDSQESSHAMEHVLSKQCPQKHSVRPLDFSSQCYRDVAVSPDTRWLNTSADSGAFFLDSPGTEKKSNLDEYPNTASNSNDFAGTVSPVPCTSSKMLETERLSHHDCDIFEDSVKHEEKVSSSRRTQPRSETKHGSKHHRRNGFFAPGFQDLDEIGENYLDISLRESVHSSTSSDFSFCAKKPSRNRNSTHSRTSRNSPRLRKRVSGQEIQKLLDSIDNDKRVLRQLQQNNLFDRKHSPSLLLPSSSSFESIGDLFYQDCYKSLPSHCSNLGPVLHKV